MQYAYVHRVSTSHLGGLWIDWGIFNATNAGFPFSSVLLRKAR